MRPHRLLILLAFLILLPLVTSAMNAIGPRFTDVPDSAWFAASVQQAVDLGIARGYKDANGNPTGKFGPENPVTIAEALKIALESAGYDKNLGSGYGHWAAQYLSIAIGEHFALTPNQNINLDRSATRAEVASLIADAFKAPMMLDTLIPENFTDVDDANPNHHYTAVNQLLQAEIITGDNRTCTANVTIVCPKTTFRPLSFINRAETVKIAMAARTFYRNGPGIDSSSRRSGTSSSTGGTCTLQECGYAPGMPNWQCSDGSIGGPSCERLPDSSTSLTAGSRCGWLIRQCPIASVSSSSSRSSSFRSSSSRSSSSRSSSSRSSSRSSVQANVTVLYLGSSFTPSTVRIGVGQTVIFKNTVDQDVRISSNPHPTHTDYQGFDSGRILLRDEEYAFTFTKKGTFGYHNHIIPNHGGAVIVE